MVSLSHAAARRAGGDADQPGGPGRLAGATPTPARRRCGRPTTRGRSTGRGSCVAAARWPRWASATRSASSACPSTSTRRGRSAPRCRADVYLWVNAAEGRRYDRRRGGGLDRDRPAVRSQRPPAPVASGSPATPARRVVSVVGDGTVRRCHFIAEPIGNLYDGSWRAALRPRACSNAICDCHIGYVHTSITSSSARCSRRVCSSASRCRRRARPACTCRS